MCSSIILGQSDILRAFCFAAIVCCSTVVYPAESSIPELYTQYRSVIEDTGAGLNPTFNSGDYSKFGVDVGELGRGPPWAVALRLVSTFPKEAFGDFSDSFEYIEWDAVDKDISHFCDEIKVRRSLPFDAGEPLPIVVLPFRWTKQLSGRLQTNCGVNTDIFSDDSNSVFMEIPVGLSGLAVLSKSSKRFPYWITPNHLAVAGLAGLPLGATQPFGPDIRPVKGPCVPSKAQPDIAELEEALRRAPCVISDSDGHRLVGEQTLKYTLRPEKPPGSKYSDSSKQDLSNITYTISSSDNNLTNWADIDEELYDAPIDIHVVGEPTPNVFAWELCKRFPALTVEKDFRQITRFKDKLCVWRQSSEVTMEKQLDGSGVSKLHSTATVIGGLPWYLDLLRSSSFSWDNVTPIAFHRSKDLNAQRLFSQYHPSDVVWFYSDFKAQLLSGQYPLSDVVWVYMDPRTLKNQRARQFMQNLLSGGLESSHFVTFGAINRFIPGR